MARAENDSLLLVENLVKFLGRLTRLTSLTQKVKNKDDRLKMISRQKFSSQVEPQDRAVQDGGS